MWTRKELKARGKAALKRNYGKTLLVALVLALTSGGIAIPQLNKNLGGESTIGAFEGMSDQQAVTVLLIVLAVVAVISLIATAISVFVLNPLQVGCQRFFVKNSERGPRNSLQKRFFA